MDNRYNLTQEAKFYFKLVKSADGEKKFEALDEWFDRLYSEFDFSACDILNTLKHIGNVHNVYEIMTLGHYTERYILEGLNNDAINMFDSWMGFVSRDTRLEFIKRNYIDDNAYHYMVNGGYYVIVCDDDSENEYLESDID